ncbi:MOSC domain-containing protein [Chondrocystis sp. NIES-4102]|nr:MOSC domain-containing protein [Chondrocystis sp. NIES-4102]
MSVVNPYVAKLFIYPIKSLDWVDCDRVTILKSGALQGDRTWAIVDAAGNFVNAKRHVKIHGLLSQFDLVANTVSLQIKGTSNLETFNLDTEQTAICTWLEKYFGFPLRLQQDLTMGFPDDTISPGATIISTATLEAIASWYPELDIESIRRRFRANIEIAGVPAFWEDQLFSTAKETVKFKIGAVEFMGVNPCQRCIVVSRDPDTGEVYPQFQKIFTTQRRENLPQWTVKERFNHFYCLAVNTKLSPTQADKVIEIGDPVEIL